MGRLAVIGGHSILGAEPAAGLERELVETEHGKVLALVGEGHILLQRHGLETYTTAAKINHRANLSAIRELGCDRIIAIGSVGGLRPELGVGTFLCPDDFIALQLGLSFSDQHAGERVPAFDGSWRERVLGAWRHDSEVELQDGGVYWQAIGPRFETPAEIRLIAAHADVIGMTIASECTLAGELGLAYATICVVDNLANGVGGAPLAVEDF
ncbi:MAG: MTAP family purine nucleoside phosphorylase, partial [Solirubrobacterales bacterium]